MKADKWMNWPRMSEVAAGWGWGWEWGIILAKVDMADSSLHQKLMVR